MSTASEAFHRVSRTLTSFWALLAYSACSEPLPPRVPETGDSTVLTAPETAVGTARAEGGSSRQEPPSKAAPAEISERQDYERATRASRTAPLRSDLLRIDLSQASVLVASVMDEHSYKKYYAHRRVGDQNTAPADYGVIWVTAVPELKEFCTTLKGSSDQLELRVAQWLGLPPEPERRPAYVVEFALNPKGLQRPCVDNEVDDSTCNPPPSVQGDTTQGSSLATQDSRYQEWLRTKLQEDDQYPFTARGYTYDWAPGNDVKNRYRPKGASEFILRPSASYEIRSLSPLDRYCGLAPNPE